VARLTFLGRPICFQIGGRYEPDSALIARARDIFKSLDRFAAEVATFLAGEAARDEWAPFAAEIGSLAILDICLFWPRRAGRRIIPLVADVITTLLDDLSDVEVTYALDSDLHRMPVQAQNVPKQNAESRGE
jgi:hypothetical protein